MNEIIHSVISYLQDRLDYNIVPAGGLYRDIEDSVYVEFCNGIYNLRLEHDSIFLKFLEPKNGDLINNNRHRECLKVDLNKEDLSLLVGFFKYMQALSRYNVEEHGLYNCVVELLDDDWDKSRLDKVCRDSETHTDYIDLTITQKSAQHKELKIWHNNYFTAGDTDRIFYYSTSLPDNRDLMLNISYYRISKDHRCIVRKRNKGYNLRDVRSYRRLAKWIRSDTVTEYE